MDIRAFFTSTPSTSSNKGRRRHKVIDDSSDEDEDHLHQPAKVSPQAHKQTNQELSSSQKNKQKDKTPTSNAKQKKTRAKKSTPKVEMSASEFFGSNKETLKQTAKKSKLKSETNDAMDLDEVVTEDDRVIQTKKTLKSETKSQKISETQVPSTSLNQKKKAKIPPKLDQAIPAFTKLSSVKTKELNFDTPMTGRKWYPGMKRDQPPSLGQKDIPIGAPSCLAKLRFVITGTLESLERDDAADLIKKYGGRVTGTPSGATDYLVRGSNPGPSKIAKAEKFGTKMINEDGLFDLIRQSNPSQTVQSTPKKTPKKKKNKKSITKNQSVSDGLWVEKYRPKYLDEIIGNQTIVKKLMSFLQNWESEKRSGRMKQYAALLSGPPGIGKTTAAHVAGHECNFEVLEFNASDTRSRKVLQNVTKNAGDSMGIRQFCSGATGASSKKVIIMDEVDGMSAGDYGGMAELIAFIKKSRVPIICICNDRSSPKVRSLASHCLDLRFRRPTVQQISKRLIPIIEDHVFDIDKPSLEKLIATCHADIRQVLNTIQMWSTNSDGMTFEEVKENLKNASKDLTQNVFDVSKEFFRIPQNSKTWFNEHTGFYFVDPNLTPLFVQDQYASCNHDKSTATLSRIADAADCISEGDILGSHMRSNLSFNLMPLHAAMSCVMPGRLVAGIGGRGQIQFPSWLGKNSSRRKSFRLLKEIKSHMSTKVSGDGLAILLDYLPLVENKLVEPLVQQGKDGVDDVISFMKNYGLSLDDSLSVAHFMEFYNSSKKRSKIPSAVKAHLTRTFKKRVHLVTKKKRKRSESIKQMKDEDDDDYLAGDEPENDVDEDDVDVLIVEKKRSKSSRPRSSKKSRRK